MSTAMQDRKKIKNLTTDWNDGTVIAALVDAMAPGLMPDWNELDPENAVENATRAMKLAEDWLGVPMVRNQQYAMLSDTHVSTWSLFCFFNF